MTHIHKDKLQFCLVILHTWR